MICERGDGLNIEDECNNSALDPRISSPIKEGRNYDDGIAQCHIVRVSLTVCYSCGPLTFN